MVIFKQRFFHSSITLAGENKKLRVC